MQTKTSNGATPRAASRPGFGLGRVAGIEVRLHWTWLAASASLSVSLASGVLPAGVGRLSGGTYLAMGTATALLFFVSLLLHELGHALAARRDGIDTRAITLWMLGGVAETDAPFPTPGSEARAALAGPAVSATLGAVLVATGNLAGLPPGLAAVLEWVGWTNVLLLTLNLLPALPLDGGRLLRAALWRSGGSRLEATRAVARVSQAISIGLLAACVASVLVGGAFGGLWLAFIALFVRSAGTAERAAAEAQAALAGLHVADVMTPNPVMIASSATPDDLLELARSTGHTTYPVIDERGDAIGLVSVAAADRIPERQRPWISVRELVAEVPQPLPLDADAEVLSVVPALAGNPLQQAAVLRAGRLVGLLSLGDVTRAVRLPAAPAGAD